RLRPLVSRPLLIVHERLGTWARQVRPLAARWPARLVETRSAADLDMALRQVACPVLLIDLADRIRAGLDDLDRAVRLAPNALTPGRLSLKEIDSDVWQEEFPAHGAGRPERLEGSQRSRARSRSRRPGNGQGYQGRRQRGDAHREPHDPGLPAQGRNRTRRPR